MEILRDYGLIFISFILSMIYAIEPLFKDFTQMRDELKKEVSELISQIKSK